MKIQITDKSFPQALLGLGHRASVRFLCSPLVYPFLLVFLLVFMRTELFGNAVSAGNFHSLCVKSDGSLWAMGSNNKGELGDGTRTDRITPVQIESSGVTAVAAGYEYSLYLKSDGSLWGMGSNYYGQLGDGTTTHTTPVQIEASGVTAVAAGDGQTLYVKSDGSLWTMGRNFFGQLGDGSTTNRTTPVQIESSGVTAVGAGSFHSFYVKSDGSLWAMGCNTSGELGDGTTTDRSTPVQIESSGVTMVDAGGGSSAQPSHSMYVKSDGSLWAMGNNRYGQLGDGTQTNRSTPVQVQSSGVTAIAVGYIHSLFLKSDGSLWGMGDSYYGVRGNGSTNRIDRTPQRIVSSGVSSVACNWSHSLYLKSDDSLWGMGRNNWGFLGDGTTTQRTTPVQAVFPSQTTLTLNAGVGGTVSGGGTYYNNQTATVSATPAAGYLFGSWAGPVASTSANPTTVDMSTNREVNATFVPDTADNDGDGLTNYDESVTHGTDPNDTDTDDDGFTDGEEIQFSLNPNVPDTALMAYIIARENAARSDGNTSGISYVLNNLTQYNLYTEAEKNASDLNQYNAGYAAGLSDGNTSGISYVLNNLTQYNLYTEAEKNASDLNQYNAGYAAGLTDGNTSGISYVLNNLSQYNLYTEVEKNASDLNQYNAGLTDGNATGISWVLNNPGTYNLITQADKNASDSNQYAKGMADVQTSLASGGLVSLHYLQDVDLGRPYTSQWFYQPGQGWLWTSRQVFPFVYRAGSATHGTSASWLYFNQSSKHNKITFYDYSTSSWIEQDF